MEDSVALCEVLTIVGCGAGVMTLIVLASWLVDGTTRSLRHVKPSRPPQFPEPALKITPKEPIPIEPEEEPVLTK